MQLASYHGYYISIVEPVKWRDKLRLPFLALQLYILKKMSSPLDTGY